jgi:deazaflavin-dependent oxidoreductase (nitroreductase family)
VPFPRSYARLNKRLTNRITGHFAPYLPGFGVVVHIGRKTHRLYRTPVNVFQRPDGFVIALTYGPDSDWVHNVLSKGECTLETRGQTVRLVQPRVVHDAYRRLGPAPVRFLLGLGHVSDFLDLTSDSEDCAGVSGVSV